jgi:hypothetical protein
MHFELGPIQHTIVACVHQYSGKLPRSAIAKLLLGSSSMRVATLRDSRFFGRLAHHRRKDVMHHIDVLLQQGVLGLDGYQCVIVIDEDALRQVTDYPGETDATNAA